VEPYQIKDNYKYWTVVAQASRLPEQINRLDEKFQVQVKSVRDLSTADTVEHVDVINRLFDDSLSARQREAILTAARHGYYQWPRAASADDIADEMNISSPTFLEHLRTAEQKVMSRLFQHLNEQNQHRINQLE
jgi:predicted DNA binding protein